MSPKFLEKSGFVFKIYSREEIRMHVHIVSGKKTAKCWLEPKIEMAENKGFKEYEVTKFLEIIVENEQSFKDKWKQHLG